MKKKIYYWSPFLVRIATPRAVVNSAYDMQKFSKSNSDNEKKEAERIDALLQPVHKALFIESNPSPVKYAAKLLGLCDDAVRLPLVKIMDKTKTEVKKSLVSAKLLNE